MKVITTHQLTAAALDKPQKRERKRRPTLAAAKRQADKIGVGLAGATFHLDGKLSVEFGQPGTTAAGDEIDQWLAKRHAH